MPSFTFDPDSVLKMNEKDLKAFLADLVEEKKDMTEPKQPEGSQDPLGERPVVQQARKDVTDASKKSAVPTAPDPPKTFQRTSDRLAANAIRLSLGSNAYRVRTHYAENFFVPDFTNIFVLLNVLDFAMLSTDKFVKSAEFWTPLVSRAYIAVLCIVQTMRAIRVSQIGYSYEIAQFLEWFEELFDYKTLPVPGPLINLLSAISACKVSSLNYRSMVPRLPNNSRVLPQNRWFSGNNLASRFPNVPILLQQLWRHYSAIGAATTAREIGRWNGFLASNFDANLFVPAAGDTQMSHIALGAAWNNANNRANMYAPGLNQVYRTNENVGRNMLDYVDFALAIIPAEFTGNAQPAGATPADWRRSLGFEGSTTWFLEFARVMTNYSKFWKESCSLDEISPIGHTAPLNAAAYTATPTAPTTRYPPINMPRNFTLRVLNTPEADQLDAQVSGLNTTGSYVAAANANAAAGDVVITGGPYYDLALEQFARNVDPSGGWGQVVIDHYHVANPKA